MKGVATRQDTICQSVPCSWQLHNACTTRATCKASYTSGIMQAAVHCHPLSMHAAPVRAARPIMAWCKARGASPHTLMCNNRMCNVDTRAPVPFLLGPRAQCACSVWFNRLQNHAGNAYLCVCNQCLVVADTQLCTPAGQLPHQR